MPVLFDLAAWGKIPSQVQAYFFSNENLITGELINWSYSQNLVRIKLPVGVPYEADLEKAQDLMQAVAGRTKRVLQDPSPACRFVGFGDSTINLELRVWLDDPQNGVGNIKSELYWGIWKEFREHHLGFLTPQETSA